ncbi:MAG: histidine phosphatase family protein [Bacteroidetes bacterium]|jgi:phosphohistidine phosphatase|nr:histidine phosphatase family protein [Bacteroidota bacterium]
MKTLYIIRHAKSDWDQGLADFERPLNARGLRNAPFMGKLLRDRGVKFDLVISSPARRALHTARFICSELGYPLDAIWQEAAIYEATTGVLQQLVLGLPAQHDTIALFGHNPGLTRLANLLAGTLQLDNLPTCGMVVLQFDVADWQYAETGTGRVLLVDYPRKHAAE